MAAIKKVGVLGAGLMGSGIAQVTATAGFDVVGGSGDIGRIAPARRDEQHQCEQNGQNRQW